jgi:two-component system chemotaxis sensor kinase CheA
MILDIDNVARSGHIDFKKPERDVLPERSSDDEEQTVILFDIGAEERFAIPLNTISRVQEIHTSEIQMAGGREYLNFMGDLIPLVRLEQAVEAFESSYQRDCVYVIIPKCQKPIGLMAANILDTMELVCRPEPGNIQQQGILGSQFVKGKMTLFLDIISLISRVEPGWFSDKADAENLRFLVVDDTPFYRNVLSSFFIGAGINITLAGNGREALQLMEKSDFNAVVSDIDMPVMDGLEFIRNVRKNQRYKNIPALAISANETDTIHSRALKSGFSDFQSKLVPDKLMEACAEFIRRVKSGTLL